jgi:DNA-binding transcriptional regulator YiaG
MRRGKRQEWNSRRIRALRQHLGLTQQQLADQMGTRQQTISEWELGMYRPRGASSTLLTIISDGAGFKYQVKQTEEQS